MGAAILSFVVPQISDELKSQDVDGADVVADVDNVVDDEENVADDILNFIIEI